MCVNEIQMRSAKRTWSTCSRVWNNIGKAWVRTKREPLHPREHPDWRKQGGHHSAKHYSRKILRMFIYLFIRRHVADLPVTVKSDATCLLTPSICYFFNPCTTLFTLQPAGHALVLYTIFCEVWSQKTWFFKKTRLDDFTELKFKQDGEILLDADKKHNRCIGNKSARVERLLVTFSRLGHTSR